MGKLDYVMFMHDCGERRLHSATTTRYNAIEMHDSFTLAFRCTQLVRLLFIELLSLGPITIFGSPERDLGTESTPD